MFRKQWEVQYVSHVVHSYGLCKPGKRGLVFAVGLEFLPMYFANLGCDIVATDLPVSDDPTFAAAWGNTGQHSAKVEALYHKGRYDISMEEFKQRVTFKPENMNALSPWLMGERFDFIWSLCSIEHVGSIELGQKVVLNSLKLLKPGGVAFHSVVSERARERVSELSE